MFKSIIASIGNAARSATRAVGSWIGTATERVAGAASRIGSGVAGAASRIGSGVAGAASRVGSGVAGAWRGARDGWAVSGRSVQGDDDAAAREERWMNLSRAARARRGEELDDAADARWRGLWDGDWETDFEREWDGTLPPNVELVEADAAPMTHSGMFFSLAQALDYCSEIPCDVTIWRVRCGADVLYFVEVVGSDGAR